VVDWDGGVFISCCNVSNCTLAHAMNGRISAAVLLALANQLPLPMIVKCGWSGFYIGMPGFSCSFLSIMNASILSAFLGSPVASYGPGVRFIYTTCVMFTALTLSFECQQEHLTSKNTASASQTTFVFPLVNPHQC